MAGLKLIQGLQVKKDLDTAMEIRRQRRRMGNDLVFNEQVSSKAEEDEIKLGNAKIKTVIDGTNIEEFDINIIKIDKNNETKNILFEIKDKKLLEKTGGIIQGMSGAPILQEGRIVGAVTHVLVNDPTRGYGIFIENMLDAAG